MARKHRKMYAMSWIGTMILRGVRFREMFFRKVQFDGVLHSGVLDNGYFTNLLGNLPKNPTTHLPKNLPKSLPKSPSKSLPKRLHKRLSKNLSKSLLKNLSLGKGNSRYFSVVLAKSKNLLENLSLRNLPLGRIWGRNILFGSVLWGMLFGGIMLEIGALYGQNTVESTENKSEATNQAKFSSDVGSFVTISDIKKRLAKKFATYQTYQANLKEVFQGKLRQGKIFIKKPHRVRLTYYLRDRIDMDVFSGEKLLYVYLPKHNIVYEQDLVDEANEDFYGIKASSLKFLFDNYSFDFDESEDLAPIFDAETAALFNITEPLSTHAYKLRLIARDITRGLDKLTLWVTQDGLILRSRARSIDRKVVDLYFYDIVLDSPIPESTFEFVLESSSKIIKNSLK